MNRSIRLPHLPHLSHLLAAAVTSLLLLGAVPGAATAADADQAAWDALSRLRAAWTAAGPQVAEFRQTFTPAGFSAGDVENGTVALDLPGSLRWDYRQPEVKSFLLRDSEFFSWIPGETNGRRGSVDLAREAGLDLLLLPVAELRTRYQARLAAAGPWGASAGRTIALEPRSAEAPLRAASLVLRRDEKQILAILYTDRDGNQTRFDLEPLRPLAEPSIFDPPAGVTWSSD